MMLYMIVFVALTQETIGQNPTTCPEIFSYETREGCDRWYEETHYPPPNNLTEVWLHFTLNGPTDILENWFGQVTTSDNTAFVIRKEGYSLQSGQYPSMRLFVKFDPDKPTTMTINGNEVCTDQRNKPVYNSKYVENNQVLKLNKTPHSDKGFMIRASSISLANNAAKSIKCGNTYSIPIPEILQDEETSSGQWPWHSALYHHKGCEIKNACEATLKTEHVITMAHCITSAGTTTVMDRTGHSVGLGRHNLKSFEEDYRYTVMSRKIVRPKYNPQNLYNDIAVLKLSKSVQITNFARPCCLRDEGSDLLHIAGREVVVMGQGIDADISHKLMQTKMPVVYTRCNSSKAGTSLCRGDSGGTMFFRKKKANGQTVWYIRRKVSPSF